MKIWLTQRAEPTPHDDKTKRRMMRTGLLAEYLSSKGDEVLWWTGDYDHYGQRQRRHENAVLRVNDRYSIKYINAKGYNKTKSFARLRYDFMVAKGFSNSTSVENLPDAIIASLPSVDLAAASVEFGKKNNIPVIVDIRDLHPDIFVEGANAFTRPLIYAATRPMASKVSRICQDATAVWGNSDFFVQWACKFGNRKRTEHDKTFPIAYKPLDVGVDETAKIIRTWHEKGLFQQDKLNIVFFGSLSKSFDFASIFESAKDLHSKGSKSTFHFFGSGELNSYIEAQCSILSNCHYFGPVGAAHLQAAMTISDIGLAPYINSKNFTQNMPNKAAEYLGGGLTIALSLRNGLLSDFLNNTKSGFSYGTAAGLTEKLIFLENNPQSLSKSRRVVNETFKRYLSYDIVSERMRESIKNLTKKI